MPIVVHLDLLVGVEVVRRKRVMSEADSCKTKDGEVGTPIPTTFCGAGLRMIVCNWVVICSVGIS